MTTFCVTFLRTTALIGLVGILPVSIEASAPTEKKLTIQERAAKLEAQLKGQKEGTEEATAPAAAEATAPAEQQAAEEAPAPAAGPSGPSTAVVAELSINTNNKDQLCPKLSGLGSKLPAEASLKVVDKNNFVLLPASDVTSEKAYAITVEDGTMWALISTLDEVTLKETLEKENKITFIKWGCAYTPVGSSKPSIFMYQIKP